MLVPDNIKDLDEGQTFGTFFLAAFDSTHSLKEIFLSEESSGKNCVKAEPILPVSISLTFGEGKVIISILPDVLWH